MPLYKLAFWGKQFTDTQSEYLLLYKNNMLQFIWKNDFNEPLFEANISFDKFCDVFNEYIEYCTQNRMV